MAKILSYLQLTKRWAKNKFTVDEYEKVFDKISK